MRRQPCLLLGLGAVLFLLGQAMPAWFPDVITYVASASLPKGWYGRAWQARAVQPGDLVLLAVPSSMMPYLPTEIRVTRVLKQVAAVAGMEVCWEPGEMMIATAEGPWLVYPYHPESPAVRVAEGCHVLGADELVIVGTHERSFDSRYVGPVARSLVQWRAVPLWTWEGK